MQTTRSPETDRLRELEVVLKKAQVPFTILSHIRTIPLLRKVPLRALERLPIWLRHSSCTLKTVF
jgi:hypothetical protein